MWRQWPVPSLLGSAPRRHGDVVSGGHALNWHAVETPGAGGRTPQVASFLGDDATPLQIASAYKRALVSLATPHASSWGTAPCKRGREPLKSPW